MTHLFALLVALLAAVVALWSSVAAPAAPEPEAARDVGEGGALRVLVFTKTAGYRHDSIPDGVRALRELGEEHGFEVEHTEDASIMNDADLGRFGAVVFLSTTGDILDEEQQGAFERYIRGGGGFVGVHAASDTEYGWAWYGRLVGAYFLSHPEIQDAAIVVEDREHASTGMLPERWERRDEWYDFRESPRGEEGVRVLARLDESTYRGGRMGEDHPILWCREFEGGRSWYTAGGHTKESFAEPLFRASLARGILWAAEGRRATTEHTEDTEGEEETR